MSAGEGTWLFRILVVSHSLLNAMLTPTRRWSVEVSGSGNLAKCFAVKELVRLSKTHCRSSKWVLGPDHSNYQSIHDGRVNLILLAGGWPQALLAGG